MKLDEIKDYILSVVAETTWGYVWEGVFVEEEESLRIVPDFIRINCIEIKYLNIENQFIFIEDKEGNKFSAVIVEVDGDYYFYLDNLRLLDRHNYKRIMDCIKEQEESIQETKRAVYVKELDDHYQLNEMYSPDVN